MIINPFDHFRDVFVFHMFHDVDADNHVKHRIRQNIYPWDTRVIRHIPDIFRDGIP